MAISNTHKTKSLGKNGHSDIWMNTANCWKSQIIQKKTGFIGNVTLGFHQHLDNGLRPQYQWWIKPLGKQWWLYYPKHPNTSWQVIWTPKKHTQKPCQEVFGCPGLTSILYCFIGGWNPRDPHTLDPKKTTPPNPERQADAARLLTTAMIHQVTWLWGGWWWRGDMVTPWKLTGLPNKGPKSIGKIILIPTRNFEEAYVSFRESNFWFVG